MQHTDTGAVFADLEIDYSDLMSDPVAFSFRVKKVSQELYTICKQDTSVNALTQSVKKEAANVDTPAHLIKTLNEIYSAGDDVSIPELVKLIDSVQELANDLKNTLRDRVTREATRENSTIQDKRYAHMQYVRLRKSYEAYKELIKLLNGKDFAMKLPLIPALPGNYGNMAEKLSYYMFTVNGQEYFNHRAVAKLIGLEERFATLRDFLDWCESPDNNVVEVREVK